MTENPHLSNSPFQGEPTAGNGDPFHIPYHQARRSGFVFFLPRKVRIVLIIIICGTIIGIYLNTSVFPGLLPITIALWAMWGLRNDSSNISPKELLINLGQMSFPPSDSNTIQFSDVRIYEESISHIDIYHEQISGLSKFRLLRHEFHAPDWDQLGPILQSRVKRNSPEAKIHTPLTPPNRWLFKSNHSDKW